MGKLVDSATKDKTKRYLETQATTGLTGELNPTPDNITARGWADMARSTYLNQGYNPAAAAQGAARIRNQGWLGLNRIAQDYYNNLAAYVASLDRQIDAIDIPGAAQAFFSAFGGGVSRGVGQYYGSQNNQPR